MIFSGLLRTDDPIFGQISFIELKGRLAEKSKAKNIEGVE